MGLIKICGDPWNFGSAIHMHGLYLWRRLHLYHSSWYGTPPPVNKVHVAIASGIFMPFYRAQKTAWHRARQKKKCNVLVVQKPRK